MLQTGMPQNEVARHFGVHRTMINSIRRRYQQQGNAQDFPGTGPLRATSRQQDNHIRLIWNNITQAFFNRLVLSKRRRCQAYTNTNGGHTPY